jgi:hypothetical protein
MRLIEDNVKCYHLKKLTCKGTLRQVFICLRPSTPYPLLPYTLYTCIQYIIHTEEWGEVEELNQREGWRGNSSQSWVENTNMNDCISSL